MPVYVEERFVDVIEVTDASIDVLYYIHDNNPLVIFKYWGNSAITSRLDIDVYTYYTWNEIKVQDCIVHMFDTIFADKHDYMSLHDLYITYMRCQSKLCKKYIKKHELTENVLSCVIDNLKYDGIRSKKYNFMKNFNSIYKSHTRKKVS